MRFLNKTAALLLVVMTFICALSGILLTNSAFAANEELISNGSFEQDILSNGWNYATSFEVTEEKASDGTKSLKYIPNDSYLGIAGHAYIDVKANTWYELSAKFYRSDEDQWIYVDMADIPGEAQVSAQGSGEWEYQSGLWYSGDRTAIDIRVVCEKNWTTGASGSGDYYIDEVSLKEAAKEESSILVENGSFEDGEKSWSYISGFDFNTTKYTDGKYSLKWRNGVSLSTAGHVTIPVEKNTDYILSADFFRTDKDRYMYVDMSDIADEAQIMAQSAGEWETQSAIWNSANNSSVTLRVVCEKNWATGADGNGEYYVDNIQMHKLCSLSSARFTDEKTISVKISPFDSKSASDFKITHGTDEVEIDSVKKGENDTLIITLKQPAVMGDTYVISGKSASLDGSLKIKYISADAITLKSAKFVNASNIELTIDKDISLTKEQLTLSASENYGEYLPVADGAWSISNNTITFSSPVAAGTTVIISGKGNVIDSVNASYGDKTFPDIIRHNDYSVKYTGDTSSLANHTLLNEDESSYEFTFNGTGFALYGPKGKDFGIADVLVDGILCGEIDAYSSNTTQESNLYSADGLKDGLHVVTVVKSRKNNSNVTAINTHVGFSKAIIETGLNTKETTYSLNGQWNILKATSGNSGLDRDLFDFDKAEPILVPGNIWEAFPGYTGKVWYGKVFTDYMTRTDNDRVYLRFEAVQYSCSVYLNGVYLGDHLGSEIPFEFDVTDVLNPNEENFISVKVTNTSGMLISGSNTNTGSFWDCGGIWQEVSLNVRPKVYISDVYAQPDWKTGDVSLQFTINNDSDTNQDVDISAVIKEKGGTSSFNTGKNNVTALPGKNTFTITCHVENFKLWDTENPNLYTVSASISSALGSYDYKEFNIGFRHIEMKDGFYYLNGERFYLKMTHQNTYDPLIIQGTPRDMTYQLKALDQLKVAGFNTFRSIGMATLPGTLDYADEIGLMVYEESSQSWLGKSGWIDSVYDELIIRDRNHPSLTIWGLLNEIVYAGDNRLEITRNYLTRLRELDMTRLVAWNSGSFDYNSICSHMSNSYSTTWDIYMGNESTELEQNGYYDGSLADTTIDPSKGYVGDLHFYPVYPLQQDSLEYLRVIGEGVNPVSITESGTGSMFNPYNERDKTIQEGGDLNNYGMTHWVNPLIDGLDYIYNYYPGLAELYDTPEEIIDDSDAINLRQRQLLMTYIRSNPQVNGYGLTSVSDAQGLGEGVMDNFRDYKDGYEEMLYEAWADLRWCILLNNSNSNVKVGESVKFEVDLSNIDVLPAGDYTATFSILDKNDTSVYTSNKISFTIEDGANVPLAYKIWNENIDINFPEGEYTLKASLDSTDYTPASDSLTFYVTDNRNIVDSDSQSVTVAGILPESVITALKKNGVEIHEYNSEQRIDNEVILVGNTIDGTADFWRSLYEKVAQGAYAAILNSDVLGTGYKWFPSEQSSKPYSFSTSYLGALYHNEWIFMEDDVLMEGLQTGMIDPTYYGEDLSREGAVLMTMPKTPDEVHMIGIYAEGLPLAGYAANSTSMGTYNFHNGSFTLSYFDIAGSAENSPAVERLLLNLVNYGHDKAGAVKNIDKTAFEAELDSYGFDKTSFAGYNIVNNDNPAIKYDAASKPGTGGADYIFGDETLVGDSFSYEFVGNKVLIIGTTNIDLGMAEVFIDGFSAGTIDFYSSSIKWQQVVFESDNLKQGAHTLTLKRLSTKNPSAIGTLLPIDAIAFRSDLPKAESVTINCSDALYESTSEQATASVQPAKAYNQAFEWSSSDTSIITVSDSGVISALKPGKATISAMVKDGSGTIGSKEITVLDKNAKLDITVNVKFTGTSSDPKPDKITVALVLNGNTTDTKLELNKANNFSGAFNGLDIITSGSITEYSVSVEALNNYSFILTGSTSEGYTIECTYSGKPIKPNKPDTAPDGSDKDTPDIPKSGDSSNLLIYIILASLSLAAALVLFIKKRNAIR